MIESVCYLGLAIVGVNVLVVLAGIVLYYRAGGVDDE